MSDCHSMLWGCAALLTLMPVGSNHTSCWGDWTEIVASREQHNSTKQHVKPAKLCVFVLQLIRLSFEQTSVSGQKWQLDPFGSVTSSKFLPRH